VLSIAVTKYQTQFLSTEYWLLATGYSVQCFPPTRHPAYTRGMSEPQRKRRGPLLWLADRSLRFWIGVSMTLPILYVASFGPACWFGSRSGTTILVSRAYVPVARIVETWPRIGLLIRWYARCGLPAKTRAAVPTTFKENGGVLLL